MKMRHVDVERRKEVKNQKKARKPDPLRMQLQVG